MLKKDGLFNKLVESLVVFPRRRHPHFLKYKCFANVGEQPTGEPQFPTSLPFCIIKNAGQDFNRERRQVSHDLCAFSSSSVGRYRIKEGSNGIHQSQPTR